MVFPAVTFQEATELAIEASNQLHGVINGDANAEVIVEDGSKIPSVRKAMVDSLYFKPPIVWAQGEYEDTYNQLREFVDGDVRTWWFAKGATVSTPVLMSTNPATDINWTLWSAVTRNAATYETQKRLAAEAGLNMVGSFLLGATVTTTNDVVFYETDGKYYAWGGVIPEGGYVIPAGSTPATDGGVGIDVWYSKVELTLRDTLTALSGAALITTSENISVQSKLNNIDTELLLKADKSRIGTGGGFSFRNKIVDGRFDFWYEGTSQTTSGYGSDTMWHNANVGSTKVNSQQLLTAGVDLPAIEVPTAKYFSRTVVTSVAGANNLVAKVTKIEDVGTLAGKTATLSFYAKADAIKNIAIEFNQNFGDSGSASIGFGNQLVSLSTIWKRYSITVTVPSLSGKTIETTNDGLLIRFWFDAGSNFATNSSSLGQQSGTFDLACVQLEEGSIATPFEELPMEISQMRVNRYYFQIGASGSTGFARYVSLYYGAVYGVYQLPVRMRTQPACSALIDIGDAAESSAAIVQDSQTNDANQSVVWLQATGTTHIDLHKLVADARL